MKILITIGLGIGTVFFCLVCMIIIIEIMHFIAVKFAREKTELQTEDQPQTEEIDHGTLVALIAAAVAENLGKDISAIRINSIKKIY